MSRRGGNLLEDIVAFDKFAESGVLMIEITRIPMTDKELAPSRIGVTRTGHRDDTPVMMPIIKLGFNLVAGPTGAPAALGIGIFG